jgi:hypothetical protein
MEDRAVLDRISALQGAEREHFKAVIEALLECYGKSDSAKAVLVYQPKGYDAAGLLLLGCDEFEASGLLQKATQLMGAVHIADAPPKELLN